MIADADVIRDKVEFESLIDGIMEDTQKESIMREREIVYNYFQKLDKHTILTQLNKKRRNLLVKIFLRQMTIHRKLLLLCSISEKDLRNCEMMLTNSQT